ncbi:acetyl-CoA hydrolase/transferase C-terminal domain-containing protein [uncultured Hydrogenophaga sp.]|uniref:acetyl-CoA hydrolase/transferase C-terminal domain-containing protein n=1 Tax=uncultured Hydrogenophaga sp. TaxID=199683 RepID=UPI00258CAB98|nr:acetyl-CoA hydrolase/transferase C-terminal domain-containing protein [uncultured Hydrogenophaga sp.]
MSKTCEQALQALRPGMHLYVAGSVSEPRTLLLALAASPHALAGVHVTTSFVPGLNHLGAQAFTQAASVRVLMAGPPLLRALGKRLRYVPMPWSQASAWLSSQRFDMAWFQATPPDARGRCSLGLGADFASEVLTRSRSVVIETCDQLPRTKGHDSIEVGAHVVLVQGTDGPYRLDPVPADDAALRIAERVAQLVRDGDTLQLGVGKLMGAAARGLRHHRHLGVHSGVIGDEIFELLACGAIDGRHKVRDAGVVVTAGIAGSEVALSALRSGAPVEVRPARYTHDAALLASQSRLVAMNGALEVDLRGQVNVEWAAGRRVSSPGGFTDFIRGAQRAPHGRALVLLQACTPSGASRIVPTLATPSVTSPLDAPTVVTEFGTADLRWLDECERAAALIAVAAPEHRDSLSRAAREMGLA